MDFLNFDRIFFVHRSDVFYVRRVRAVEVAPVDGDIGIYEPVRREVGVIVFRDHRKRRFITDMRLDDLVRGNLPFVDLGGGRYVPAANIREICEAPPNCGHQGTEIWIEGSPYAVCMVSAVPVNVMQIRWEAAMARLPDAPIPGGLSVRLPCKPIKTKAKGVPLPLQLAA